jgi:dihydroceramidase
MQLIDELSMIYTTCLMCFASISFQKSLPFRFLAGTFLVALAIFITVYYHLTQDPVFHQTAYALLTIGVLVHSMWVMEHTLRPQLSGHGRLPRMPDDGRRLLRDMWFLVSFGITVFLAGFVIWNLDNIYCDSIRRWRRGIGLPWAILLEGHGWWHLLTGIGAYIYIVWGIWLRRCLEDKSSDFNLHWPNIFTSVPEVKATRCFKDMKRE